MAGPVTRLIHFGEGAGVTQEWASDWLRRFPDHITELLRSYRERVSTYYSDNARLAPAAFFLYEPVAIRAIATLSHIWVFAAPAADVGLRADSIEILEEWENPLFSSWEFQQSPREHRDRQVRVVLR